MFNTTYLHIIYTLSQLVPSFPLSDTGLLYNVEVQSKVELKLCLRFFDAIVSYGQLSKCIVRILV